MDEVWKKIRDALDNNRFGKAGIIADGFRVEFRTIVQKNRLMIMTYVDGVAKGEWCVLKEGTPVSEEARKFLFPVKAAVWSKRSLKALSKVFGKKRAREMTTPVVIGFFWVWPTARTLVNHLRKTCTTVVWIPPEEIPLWPFLS